MAQPQSIAGTYFTSWESDPTTSTYQLGPIVVIGTDNSVTVDGVPMANPVVLSGNVTWLSAAGNPSSALLQFTFSSTYNAWTFTGIYWTTSDQQPQTSNFYGFATQPNAPLTTWSGTYYGYEGTASNQQSTGDVVIDGSGNVSFAGVQIINPIYTGLYANGTDSNELAWFTSDGNENNVAISFFTQTTSSGLANFFNGNIWPDGSSRPEGSPSSANNFFGTTQSESDAGNAVIAEIANAAHDVENALLFVAVEKMFANNKADNDADDDDDDDDDDADDADDADDNAGDAGAPNVNDANQDVAQNVGQNAEENAQQANLNVGEQQQVQDNAAQADDDAGEGAGDDAAGEATAPNDGTPRGRAQRATGMSARELLDLKSRR